MAIGKLYIGRKVRDLRDGKRLTQGQFAERIGISTSYLNQIENNQRPVSAAVLLALAEKFQIDIAELSSGESDRLLSALSEALSDPLFETYSPSLQELKLVAQNAPGLAHALISCHQAYRRNSEQLASIDDTIGRGASFVETTPYEEVRDFFHFVDNYIHEIDMLAETLAGELGLGDGDNHAALAAYLEARHGIRVVRGAAGDEAIRRFDPRARLLTLNPYAPAATRDFQLALQIAQMHAREEIDRVAGSAGFRTEEAYEICRIGLQNYFAGALILPYQPFLKAARDLRHDVELLAARFGASLEQVCHRLSTLQRPGQKGIPIFFARIDRAGNITKRHSAPSCNSPVSVRPVRSGTCTRPSRRPAGSSASLRRRRMACAISVLRPRPPKAAAATAPPIPVTPWRSAVKSPTPTPSSMRTTWTSATAPPTIRSEFPAASASAPDARAVRCRHSSVS